MTIQNNANCNTYTINDGIKWRISYHQCNKVGTYQLSPNIFLYRHKMISLLLVIIIIMDMMLSCVTFSGENQWNEY